MHGLVIREPWIDLILDGQKTWELRTMPTKVRGRIALIRKGSGLIEGTVDLVDSLPRLDAIGLADSEPFHRVPPSEQPTAVKNGWLFPWLVLNSSRLPSPIRYAHPSGAVTFVKLHESTVAALNREHQGTSVELDDKGTCVSDDTTIELSPSRHSSITPKIDPALERLLTQLAMANGFTAEPLASSQTKMRRFSTGVTGHTRHVLLNRMQNSSQAVAVFIAPNLDQQIEQRLQQVDGVTRYANKRGSGYAMKHSAFRILSPVRSIGEPEAHGWLISTEKVTSAFPAFLAEISAT